MILGIVDGEKGTLYRKLIFIFAGAMTFIQVVFILFITFYPPEIRRVYVSYVFIGQYLILSVTYVVIMQLLRKTLKRMEAFADFEMQHKDIQCQILFYFFAMLT